MLVPASVLPAGAQAPGVVSGTVTAGDSALPNAYVLLVGTHRTTVSDGAGRFRFVDVPTGNHTVEVRFLGFSTVELEFDVTPEELVSLEVALTVEPLPLDDVTASALGRLTPQLRGFYERRERGAGYFLTRDEIERIRPNVFTDVLRRVPGVDVRPGTGRYGSNPRIQIGRATGIAGARECPVLYFVDGVAFRVEQEIGINNFVRPADVAGIEVYSGSSRIPAQFHASNRNARCGVVVIWTRSGPDR